LEVRVPKKPLVAIVDDDESIRDATKDLLDAAGFAAATFPSAESFLQSNRRGSTSCLVTDVRMPGMTGLELHQDLVASGTRIPTILMTAYPDDRVRTRARKAGVVCYLIKPFTPDELLECIRSALAAGNAAGEKA
jgi:FixJ family two-component response regulator